MLQKYVNLTKGFRDRLFVLKDEKLDYYKVGPPQPLCQVCHCCCPDPVQAVLLSDGPTFMQLSGKHAVNVQQVLDHYDPTADITLIGAKILLIQNEHARKYAVLKPCSYLPAVSTKFL